MFVPAEATEVASAESARARRAGGRELRSGSLTCTAPTRGHKRCVRFCCAVLLRCKCPDQGIGVLVERKYSDRRDTDYRSRGRPPNDPIGRCHRTPPIAKVLVSAISLLCPIGRLGPRTHLTDR